MEKKRRNRAKQTTSLNYRLHQLIKSARRRAENLPVDSMERAYLLKKAGQAEQAVRMADFLSAPRTSDRKEHVGPRPVG
ncbi:hypothetical protein JQ615_18680 [Bradyrhizobium jicamae]|uniref:Uncharacterized protein n=1 Tax=Bradyrhizobium jicamae TaxID=280332 RepID=A0ABS5FKV1_9BRAD|nr:hypothetical protein [Bradyrhizobium jicamae]MBR0797417.1 hypothetical protein [Bradyrhizobium jicamae]